MKHKLWFLGVALMIGSGFLFGLFSLTHHYSFAAPPSVGTKLNTQNSFFGTSSDYLTATVLLEELENGDLVELSPAQTDWWFDQFFILQEGITHTLWLNNRYPTPPDGNRVAVEQRLQSIDGLIWKNRIDTNLVDDAPDWHTLMGIRQVIKDDGTYHGWESVYYNSIDGMWALYIRYIYSSDGITWYIGNDPALESGREHTVIKEDDTYHMWVRIAGDSGYTGPQMVRYRTSTQPGSGWGHWQTGGTAINVDGEEVRLPSRVRKLDDGTYQLFYRPYEAANSQVINLATSDNGITFTLEISGLVNYPDLLPDFSSHPRFQVVDMNGEDWFYFAYLDTNGQGRMAVIHPDSQPVYLPVVLNNPCTEISTPADIILSLDTSGSMGDPAGDGSQTKLDAAKEAASNFIDLLDFPNDQAGIVSFDNDATLDHSLSVDATSLHNALQVLVAGGATRIDLALAVSRDELTGPRHNPDSSAVLILLTDGYPNGATDDEVLAEADAAKAAGVIIYTIGLGDNVHTSLMQAVATTPAHYFYAPSTAELTDIYEQIANVVHCP